MRGEIETEESTAPCPSEWPATRLRQLVLIGVTALAVLTCVLIAAPFLSPLTAALSLAVLVCPLHRRIERRLRNANLSAFFSALLVALMVLLPIILVGERLLLEAADAAMAIKARVDSGEWIREIEINPRLSPVARWVQQHANLHVAVDSASAWLTAHSASLVRGSLIQIVGFLVTIYLLFFFLRDRVAILAALHSLSPLPDEAMRRIDSRVEETIHAIIYGVLVIAVAKGTLGGLMFWWLGLAAPLFWGIVMGLLAAIPLLGSYIVWVPAAVVLLVEGHWIKALILAAWGLIVVSLIDNVLYPVLIGSRLRMHTALAFIALAGGLLLFGPAGLLLGPLVVTLTLSLLEGWRDASRTPEADESRFGSEAAE
jgi:predicted PurR-regulated permease PerM